MPSNCQLAISFQCYCFVCWCWECWDLMVIDSLHCYYCWNMQMLDGSWCWSLLYVAYLWCYQLVPIADSIEDLDDCKWFEMILVTTFKRIASNCDVNRFVESITKLTFPPNLVDFDSVDDIHSSSDKSLDQVLDLCSQRCYSVPLNCERFSILFLHYLIPES